MVRAELRVLLKDPKSDYYTTDKKKINYVLEDRDEYSSRNPFKIPETESLQYLKDNEEQDDIKVKMDDAFDVIPEILTGYNPQLVNIPIAPELSAPQ